MPVVGALVVAGWFTFGPGHGKSAASSTSSNERLVTATAGTLANTVSAQGTVADAQTDDLNFASAGTVTAVNVAAGQKVTKGQVLATIDSAALVSAFEDAQANAASAAATLSDDEAAGASSAQISADETRLTSEQDALSTAYANLGNAQLAASFDGTVASVNLTVGEQLTSSGTGATSSTGASTGRSAADLASASQNQGNGQSNGSTAQIEVVSAGSYTVSLGVDATDVKSLAVGQSAAITLTTATNTSRFGRFGAFAAAGGFGGNSGAAPAGGGNTTGDTGNGNPTTGGQAIAGTASATGTVTSVGTVADASSGVTSYPVTVTFTDTSGDYNAGATVDVDITISQEKNVVLIPAFAVTTTNGVSTVVVSNNGKDETRTVTTGQTSGAEIAITSGLQAGEQVVITFPGAGGFRNGQGRGAGGAGG